MVKVSISSTLATNAYFQLKKGAYQRIYTSRFNNTHGSILVVSLYIYFFPAFDIRVEIHLLYRAVPWFAEVCSWDHYGIGSANALMSELHNSLFES